jgi:alkaline phosphatase D
MKSRLQPGLFRRRTLLAAAGAAPLMACSTPPKVAEEAVIFRIGVASCADQSKPQPIWDAALAEQPDYFVFAGDNVYASQQPFDIANLRAAYAELAAKPNFERLRNSVPHMAVWDDHDYGLNDGGADFAHKQASKDEFLRFWRVAADDPRRKREGLYHARNFEHHGGRRVQIVVLDTRWFRSPLKPTDQRGAAGKERYLPDADPAKTMLGQAQWHWLEARLREPADVRVLVSSVQCVVEGHGFERWGNLPTERERLYKLIRDTGARGVVVLSGDRHVGGIYREANAALPYPLYEMTSSGATHPWADAKEAGPNRIDPLVTAVHYGVVAINFTGRQIELSLRDVHNKPLHQHAVPFGALRIA